MTEAELLARGLPVWRGVRDGDRVSFKLLPEARGTVAAGVYGGSVGVELDGTGERVWVPEEALERV